MDCPRCGAKVGSANWGRNCAACGRPACLKCITWEMFESHPSTFETVLGKDRRMLLCPDGCAFGQYERFIQSIHGKAPLVLNDIGHVLVDLCVDTGMHEDAPASDICFDHWRLDPRDFAGEVAMAPEARPLYDMIRADLAKRGSIFREDYSDLV